MQTGTDRKKALEVKNSKLSKASEEKIRKIRDELVDKNLKTEIVDKLCKHISSADEMDLDRIQIIPLAESWNFSKRDLLITCLHATRLGLLTLSWDVICPHCRGTRFGAKSLGDLPAKFDCGVCEIDFETDRLESVEVTFHVHPSVRKIEEVLYCVAEAARKEHVRSQTVLKAGEETHFRIILREGRHRIRKIGEKTSTQTFDVSKNETNSTVSWPGPSSEITKTSTVTHITLKNDSTSSSTMVVEELWWENFALRPAELFLLPDFRDLFSEEHLNSDVKLFLGQQTILFTDIVGSTKFYQAAGDARAFKEVKDHFNEIFKEVKKYNGVVVKTIGDAVMAAFPSAENAVNAAIEIQGTFYPNRTDTYVRLRISLHSGPVIAVHLLQGVDFFGATVNKAAKLQVCADAHEIAFTEEVYQHALSHLPIENLPVLRREAPSIEASGVPLKAVVLKIDRRIQVDRRKKPLTKAA